MTISNPHRSLFAALLVVSSIAHASRDVVTVRPGDNLFRIALNNRTSVERLVQLNGLRSTTIRVGQRLRIRPSAATVRARPAIRSRPAARVSTVVVRPGETLTLLARRHGTSVMNLVRDNRLRSSRILVGQRLLVRGRSVVTKPPVRPAGPSVLLRQGKLLGVPVHVVDVDLRDRRVFVTPLLSRLGLGNGVRLDTLARTSGATAVVNGGFFHPRTYIPAGDLVVHGRYLAAGRVPTAVAITPDNHVRLRAIRNVTSTAWRGFETVVATGPHVVRRGVVVVRPRAEGYRDAALWSRAARSAIGLRDDRRMFFLSTRAKLSLPELARIMQRAGAREAILLDGGTSTGMLWKGRPVVAPGRKVAYGIGVYVNYAGRRTSR